MFRQSWSLKQHTPLIHFQQEQAGATIRGTDLRPRLNRFIIDHAPQLKSIIPYEDEVYQYFTGLVNTGASIPYKFTITTPDTANDRYYFLASAEIKGDDQKVIRKEIKEHFQREAEVVTHSAYFANQTTFGRKGEGIKEKEISNVRLAVFNDGDFGLQLLSFDRAIGKLVAAFVHPFFLLNNFGTRSSKGLGCFETTPVGPVAYGLKELVATLPKYQAVYSLPWAMNSVSRILQETANIYRDLKCRNELKGGKWIPESAVRDYLESLTNPKYWEKYQIAAELIYDTAVRDRYGKTISTSDVLFVRALLGLTDNYEYRVQGQPKKKVVVEDAAGEIDRFASPVNFHFAEGKLWILAKEIPPIMLDRNFNFKLGRSHSTTITTPPNFSWSDFLDFALSQNSSHAWSKVK